MLEPTLDVINRFNTTDTILFISSYPEKNVNYSNKVCAVSGFAKNTIKALGTFYGEKKKFIVLTVTIDGKEELYEENNVLVWRLFERNKYGSYISLLKAILMFTKVRKTMIEFEFASFGETLTTSLFPLVPLFIRLLGKDCIFVLHQFLDNLSLLGKHIGCQKQKMKVHVLNIGMRLFYRLIVLISTKVIVHEESLRIKLNDMVGHDEKILYIPHGVDATQPIIKQSLARRKLHIEDNKLVILYFGYLTWYKGVDFLIRTMSQHATFSRNNRMQIIIAGGESVTQKKKVPYRQFVQEIYSLAKKSTNITITGHLSERDIPLYFVAADLVILPYRIFMSSSGPLSLCFSFRKPFILSSKLTPYFASPDFMLALRKVGLKENEITFSLRSNSLIYRIKELFSDKHILIKLTKLSGILRQERQFSKLSKQYAKLFS